MDDVATNPPAPEALAEEAQHLREWLDTPEATARTRDRASMAALKSMANRIMGRPRKPR